MKRILGIAALSAAVVCAGLARAETVKVGFVMPFSGEFAQWGAESKGGIEAFQHLHGDSVKGNKIEVIYRDEGGINPSRARQLATELILRDHVKFLTGFVFSPDALAIAPIITQGKTATIITNAATGFITTKSPYFTRVSMTLQQDTAPLGTWAATHGIKTVDAVIANYVAGIDSYNGFAKTFKAHGGKIIRLLKYPVTASDVTPYYERVLQDKPDAVYIFGTGGSNSLLMVKTWASRLKPAGIKFLGASLVEQTDMKNFGKAALGVTSSTHYVEMGDNPVNKALWAEWHKMYGANPTYLPDLATCSAYDMMTLVYDAVAHLGPNFTGKQAIDFFKGKTYKSPRGHFTIDAKTRDIVQDIYVQRVEMKNGIEQNVPIDVYKDVKDPWKEEHPGK